MTLTELAARCEAATGPDRELDAEIAAKLCGGSAVSPIDLSGRYWKPGARGFCIAPAYTASIDAALTLVPEGWGWHMRCYPELNLSLCELYADEHAEDEGVDYFRGRSKFATPTPAICAAALRAREPKS
jgi:hypothetical protein